MRWIGFLGISITLHLFLLGLIRLDKQDAMPISANQTFAVRLTASAVNGSSLPKAAKKTNKNDSMSAPQASRRLANPAPMVSNRPTKAKTEHTKSTAQLKSSILNHNLEPPAQTATAPSNSYPSPTAHAELQALIKADFARYFHYPHLAIRKQWQGNLLLGFQLNNAGFIEKIALLKSSGHALLDASAIASLEKIKSSYTTHSRHNQTIAMQLPVRYQIYSNNE